MNQCTKITIWGLLFFVFFSGYFAYLSEKLSYDAGPDEHAHIRAAQFIFEHNRLPVYPQDAEMIHFSRFGATRSFRPPLIYISTAALYQLTEKLGIEFVSPYRKANALIGGLCALFLLLALYIYTRKIGIAVVFSVAFMLMPQVSFIYSYLNADGVAIMATSLILLSSVLFIRKGLNLLTIVFFGIACGILSLSKLTAWVFCLPVCIFTLCLILKRNAKTGVIKPLAIILLAFTLIAGWRIGFNIHHHGIENPFNWSLDAQLNITHARITPDEVINYESLEINHLDLLRNHDNFLTKTFISTVGNLDWLRLKMGKVQYTVYGVILALGSIAVILALLKPLYTRKYNQTQYYFEISIIIGCILQFYMYLHFNIYNDIQTQGKYILPAFPGLLILTVFTWKSIITRTTNISSPSRLGRATLWLFLSVFIYTHLQGHYKFTIPFYNSAAYVDTSPDRFTPIPLDKSTIETADVKQVQTDDKYIKYEVTGDDPRLTFKDFSVDLKSDLILLKIHAQNSKSDYYNFYWDQGSGMSEEKMVKGFFPKGDNIVYQILPVSSFKQIRFDLGAPGSNFEIFDFSFAQLKYKPFIGLLNKIFFVKPTEDSL